MTDKQLISTIKYVAGSKPVFSLSEIVPYLEKKYPVEKLLTLITPLLDELNLVAKNIGTDYEISRRVPAEQYTLNPAEVERQDLFFAARRLPPALEVVIEQYIPKKVGKELTDPVILERLRRAIVAQKSDYWKPTHKRSLQYTKAYHVLGYLAYHFPVYYVQTQYLLAMLARDGLLKNSMTVLDAGTGPGVVPLAIADFYSRLEGATATVYSVERSEEHIEAFMYLREQCTQKGAHTSIKPPIKADLTTLDPAKIKEANAKYETGKKNIAKGKEKNSVGNEKLKPAQKALAEAEKQLEAITGPPDKEIDDSKIEDDGNKKDKKKGKEK